MFVEGITGRGGGTEELRRAASPAGWAAFPSTVDHCQWFCRPGNLVKTRRRLVAVTGATNTHPEHTIYPYLLRGLTTTEADSAWCADSTNIPMHEGFCWLAAIMHWTSVKYRPGGSRTRWSTAFCTEAPEGAFSLYGTPQVFNTDRGTQFTSYDFTDILKRTGYQNQHGWQGSLDGQRAHRKVLKEREAWRYVLEGFGGQKESYRVVRSYNRQQRHQGLDDRTPDEVCWRTPPRARDAVVNRGRRATSDLPHNVYEIQTISIVRTKDYWRKEL